MNTHQPKWKRQPAERPPQILDAALDVFAEKGFHAATMEEIAARAGITKGTIYLYFEGKEELFLAMVRNGLQEWLDMLPQIQYNPGEDPVEKARELGRAFLDVLLTPKYAKLIPVVLGEINHLPALRQFYLEEILPQANLSLAGLLEQGRKLGLVRDIEPVIAARCLFGMYFVLVLSQEVFGAKEVTPMTSETMADTITTVYFHGVLTEEAR